VSPTSGFGASCNSYIGKAIDRLDLSDVQAVALDETAAKRGHEYVTVFIDLDAVEKPVLFVTPGKGKECGPPSVPS